VIVASEIGDPAALRRTPLHGTCDNDCADPNNIVTRMKIVREQKNFRARSRPKRLAYKISVFNGLP